MLTVKLYFFIKFIKLKIQYNSLKINLTSVLLCPGSYFAVVDGLPSSYCRAAFSLASEEDMNEAFKRLAKLIRENQ